MSHIFSVNQIRDSHPIQPIPPLHAAPWRPCASCGASAPETSPGCRPRSPAAPPEDPGLDVGNPWKWDGDGTGVKSSVNSGVHRCSQDDFVFLTDFAENFADVCLCRLRKVVACGPCRACFSSLVLVADLYSVL